MTRECAPVGENDLRNSPPHNADEAAKLPGNHESRALR